MRTLKLTLLLAVLLAVLVLAVQNTETIAVRFLVWELSLSRFLLLLIVFLVGVFAGAVGPRLLWARRHGKAPGS